MALPFRIRPPRPPALAPDDVVTVAGWPVRLRVNPRARRVGLRIVSAAREVVAVAPSARRLPEALAFAQARADWIAGRLGALPPPRPFVPGGLAPVRGAPCRLERAAMRMTGRLHPARAGDPQRLVASGEGAAFARAVERVLRREALLELTAKTTCSAERLGLSAPAVAVADARGRWGSCRPPLPARPGRSGDAGRVRYTWRLICAPTPVLDYVVAHEAAHLVHPDHGAAFWALTRTLHGEVEPARRWLREHGAELHALGG